MISSRNKNNNLREDLRRKRVHYENFFINQKRSEHKG